MNLTRRQFVALSALTATGSAHSLLAMQNVVLPLEKYHGKVIMVDFWASWCIPCKRSFPWLNDLNKKYQDQGLVLLGVNVDENAADAKAFLEETPANFEIMYDPNGHLATEYKLKAMPSSLVFNREGILIAHHHGFKSKLTAKYEEVLRSLL